MIGEFEDSVMEWLWFVLRGASGFLGGVFGRRVSGQQNAMQDMTAEKYELAKEVLRVVQAGRISHEATQSANDHTTKAMERTIDFVLKAHAWTESKLMQCEIDKDEQRIEISSLREEVESHKSEIAELKRDLAEARTERAGVQNAMADLVEKVDVIAKQGSSDYGQTKRPQLPQLPPGPEPEK